MKREELKEYIEALFGFEKNNDVVDTVLDFYDMRKSIKKPMTERAVKVLVNKLIKMSSNNNTRIKILEQSILNNWTDIYELKKEEKPKVECVNYY